MILDKIKKDQLQARKDKDIGKSKLLTTLLGEIETLSKSGKEMNDSMVFSIIEKFIKNNMQTIQSIGPFHENYETLSDENAILVEYLPSQLTEEELSIEIDKFIKDNSNVNMGMIMKYLKKAFPNRYDGKMASKLAKELC